MKSESEELLRNLEIENGASILWKTYAFLITREGRRTGSLGGLLYIAGDRERNSGELPGGGTGNTGADGRLIFEDFESQRPYYLVLGARRKTYKKTKLQAPIDSITSLIPLTHGDAQRVIEGKLSLSNVSPPAGLRKLLDRTVHAITFTEGEPWFLELFDPKGLQNYLGT